MGAIQVVKAKTAVEARGSIATALAQQAGVIKVTRTGDAAVSLQIVNAVRLILEGSCYLRGSASRYSCDATDRCCKTRRSY